MKILHLIDTLAPRHGGPAAVLPEMCTALSERGHHVEIMTTDTDGRSRTLDLPLEVPVRSDGFVVTYFPIQAPRRFLTSFPMARALRARLAEFNIVHIHGLYRFHTLAAAILCRRLGTPYVIRPHGTLNPYHRGIRRGRKAAFDRLVGWRNLNSAAGIHYTSDAERAFAEELGVCTRGYVIPHGVRVEESNGDDIGDFFPELACKPIVLFLGRLTEKKGLDLLCEAFAHIADERPDAHLVIAGPDDEGIGEEISQFALGHELVERITLCGLVTGCPKRALFRAASVFVLPSRDESFAVAVGEAIAAAVPVVITDAVGISNEIEREQAGIVAPRTPEGFAEAISKLLEDGELRARMGSNGKRLARSRYSWGRVAEELEQMYLEAIGMPQ